MEKEKESKVVLLQRGRDMTHSKFLEWLNKKFKKPSGKEFTPQDVYGYLKRGNLPYHFGVYELTEKEHPEIGLKIVSVKELIKTVED